MTTRLRWALAAATAVLAIATAARAEPVRGLYFQVRGAVSAAGDHLGAAGGHAILGWRVQAGVHRGVRLNGLAVAAVVATQSPAEVGNDARAQTALLIDERAPEEQQAALVHLVRELAQEHLGQIVSVTPVKIDLRIAEGCACGHAVFAAGDVKVRTRSVVESDPVEFRTRPKESAFGKVFYSYNAITEEYACQVPNAQGKPVPVSGANLPTALVGGF
jgi:hypothetical protein